jgi:hypothetical protein
MFTTIFVTMALAWQSGDAIGVRPLDLIEMMYEDQARAQALDGAFDHRYDLMKQQQFVLRYNDVAKALADFGQTWNKSHQVDQRKVQRLRKAWRDLAKTDSWFDTSAESK